MEDERRIEENHIGAVRKGDIDPYTALRWVSILFKSAAVFLGVAVLAEFIAGVRADGWAAVPILLGEIARTVVFAVVLWGGGDLVRLLMRLGNDIRAGRILMTRLVHRPAMEEPASRAFGRYAEEGRGPRIERGTGEAAAD